jgi:hypothetical protein
MSAERCPDHPDAPHDPDEGCLHGWTDTLTGCPWRPEVKRPAPPGVLDRIAVAMAATGSTGFRRVSGGHDGRWRRNRT